MTSASSPELSVIVPAYNEADSIERTVVDIVAALPNPDRSEIVLVDDGSTDETLTMMRRIEAACTADVQVVPRGENGGMGQALASGFEVATGEVLTWIPGDGEYDLAEVLRGLPLLDSHPFVLVRRTARNQLGRNAVSSAMYLLIRLLFRFDAKGYCGIFLVSRDSWATLAVESRDVFFTLEAAIRASSLRWRIGEIEAEWRPRRAGRSKVFNVRTVLRNVGELLGFRWRLFRSR